MSKSPRFSEGIDPQIDVPQQQEGLASPSPALEFVTAITVTLLGAAVIIAARQISLRHTVNGIDPKWWPTGLGIGIILMGLWMLADAAFGNRKREVQASQRTGLIQVIATVIGIALVLLLWHFRVNFLLLGPLYLAGMNWIYGLRNWKSILLFPAIISVTLYALFQLLLKVPL